MKNIPLYKFYKRKYGAELLVDVLDLDYVKTGIRKAPIHRETFYCIIVVTDGCEKVAVNGYEREVQKERLSAHVPVRSGAGCPIPNWKDMY